MFNNQQNRFSGIVPNQINNFDSSKPPIVFNENKWRPRTKPAHFQNTNPYNFQNQSMSNQTGRVQDNFEHFCETCDRGFKTSQLLDSHISEHQKCGIDGCKFIAHPKVVTNHIQMQHSTGLYNKLKNLETPDDIAKWIKERKKNYPSKENIEKLKVQQKERTDRGEKLQEPKSRFNNRSKNDFNFKNNRGPKNTFNKNRHEFKRDFKKPKPKRVETEITTMPVKPSQSDIEDFYCGVPAFKGTSEIERNDILHEEEEPHPNDDIDIEDAEWLEKDTNLHKIENAPVCKALNSLIVAYQTSSEEETDDLIFNNVSNSHISKESNKITELTSNPNISNTSLPENKSTSIVPNIDSDSGPEVAAIQKTDTISTVMEIVSENKIIEKKNTTRDRKNIRKRKNPIEDSEIKTKINRRDPNRILNTFQKQLKYYKERPSTLLEKLLDKEIRHERNVILQSINYIIKNNFFDEIQPK
ncbi:nuclear FMR1 interacting protein 1 [Arctopsyche grandis]|uniref:nuclear FMR1 interacting protein 1 n=1 Tax=Arctopsyche grandis TaxID=121162 RepID=UPI00406D7ABF